MMLQQPYFKWPRFHLVGMSILAPLLLFSGLTPVFADTCQILGTPQHPSSGDIFVNGKLTAGYGLGLNTDQGRTDWLSCGNALCPDCCRMALPSGQNWGAVFITVGNPRQPPRPAADFSNFTHLEVELRGDQDGQSIQVGIKDACQPDDGTETKVSVGTSAAPCSGGPLPTEWGTYRFPLSCFTGIDLTRLYVLTELVLDLNPFGEEAAQTTYFRNIRFIRIEPPTETPTFTPTSTDTPTPTPTTAPTATASPSPTPTLGPCVGDCNDDGAVTVDELIKGVNIALGNLLLDDCRSFDTNGDGRVTVDELLRAVSAALNRCSR